MNKIPFWGQERLHKEHLSFTNQSLAFEVRRAAQEAMEIQQLKADGQYQLNKSGVFDGEVFKQFNR